MVQVSCADGQSEGKLSHAIMLYSNHGNVVFSSIHAVEGDDNRPVIGSGVPASKEAVAKLMASLGKESNSIGSIIPWKLLVNDSVVTAWYTKPMKKHLWFKAEELGGKVDGLVPLPGLIFVVTSESRYVFAHRSNDRPDASTPLYVAPFFNVWQGGKICEGNVKKPDRFDETAISEWEDAFFNSFFTHPNIKGSKALVNVKEGPYGFWKKMLAGEFKSFPSRALVPMKDVTLGSLISSITKQE